MNTYYLVYHGLISQTGWMQEIEITHLSTDIRAAALARIEQTDSMIHGFMTWDSSNTNREEFKRYAECLKDPFVLLRAGFVVGRHFYCLDRVTSNESLDLSNNDNLPVIMLGAKNITDNREIRIFSSVDECIDKFVQRYWNTLSNLEFLPTGSVDDTKTHIRDSIESKTTYGIRRPSVGEIILTNNYSVLEPLPKQPCLYLEDDLK